MSAFSHAGDADRPGGPSEAWCDRAGLLRSLLIAGSAVAFLPRVTVGQTVRVPSPVLCPSCSFTVDTVVTLSGVMFRGPATTIQRHPLAGLYLLVDATDDLLKAYRADGSLVQAFGRRGGGPGEYEMVRNVLVSTDGSVHLLDGLLGRWSVFARTGGFVRSIPLRVTAGLGMGAVLLQDGGMVINVRRVGAEATNPLVYVDREGKVTPIPGNTDFRPQQTWLQRRLLWAGERGELYVARPFAFVVDVYDRQFRRSLSLGRVDDWIPRREPQEPPADGTFDRPHTPQLMGL